MKRIIFTFFTLCLLSLSANAKDVPESSVPNEVKNYVSKNYPKAVGKEWKYKDKNDTYFYYKVEFEIDGREVELELDLSGKLLSSEEELLIKDTPSFAQDFVQKNYSGAEILGTKKKVNSGVTSYDVGIAFDKGGHTRHRNIYFDSKGNVIKQ
ncbi:MAG: hypothetical protein QM660_04970 [Dysgonomonas sp.]